MISLIRNELKKIFSKKTLYIILFILIGISVFSNIMNKKFSNNYNSYDMYSDVQAGIYEQELKDAKENNDIDNIAYYESYLEARKFAIKYDRNGWQRYIIENELQPTICDMIRTKTYDRTDSYYEEKYNRIVKNLEDNNWKEFAKDELKDIDEELEALQKGNVKSDDEQVENLKCQKQVIKWRLEKDIPYGINDLNTYLTTWASLKMELRNYQKMNDDELLYDTKVQMQRCEESIKVCEYAIENGINSNITKADRLTYNLSTDAKSLLLNVFESYGFFIILSVVVIAGTIVSEESNKGTIKLLLVRPYKRRKILLAKFITCLIILVISLITVVVIQTIVGGISFGFESYSGKTVMYNFNTNSIETISILRYLFMTALSLLPQYLLLMTLAFTISTVLTNSPMAIALPLLGIIGADIINSFLLMHYEKARFLTYFVTPNWDLSMYAFGKMPGYEGLTPIFSIIVCTVYFIGLIILSMQIFNRRDIKNV